jgi:O-glycosyl hydrolase
MATQRWESSIYTAEEERDFLRDHLGPVMEKEGLGAERVSTTSSRSPLLATSFINDDGTIATIVMNQTDAEIEYNFMVGADSVRISIPAHAMQTLVY